MRPAKKILMCLMLTLVFSSAVAQKLFLMNIIPFASGFNNPVCIAHTNDSRLFIVNQSGYINVIDSLGHVNPKPFLDIQNSVVSGGEQGLLGLAFDPQYTANGFFYVNYTGPGDSTHISRFQVSSGNPDVADSLSEVRIMTIGQPYINHNGGNIVFGPDGYLYIGLGDGGSAGDPGNRAQDMMSYLGKLLRIDVSQGLPYVIPASNPYYNSLTALGEIWSSGLRNPWRFSFDRLTGDLWIGDVGQNSIEEIDFQPANDTGGENYGWRCYEGNQVYNDSGCGPVLNYTFPVYTYPHGPECSVTGGFVYRGNPVSTYYGKYFFADYCSDSIWTLQYVAGNWKAEAYGYFPVNNFDTFGEDAGGQLYVAGHTSGIVYKVIDNQNGITGNENSADFRVLQNPFSDKITIETLNTGHTKILLALFDVRGTTLHSSAMTGHNYDINTGRLPDGLYFLKITTEDETQVIKLIRME